MKKLFGFWKNMAKEGVQQSMESSIAMAANIAPGMASAAQIRMIEDEVLKAEKNLAQARMDLKEDEKRNALVDTAFEKATKGMQLLKTKVQAANDSGNTAEEGRLMGLAQAARMEYDKAKAAHDDEHANDAVIKQRLETYQKLYDVWKGKQNEIARLNEYKKNQVEVAKANRELAELEAETAAAAAQVGDALNMFSSINIIGAQYDKDLQKEARKTEEANLRSERLGAAAPGNVLDSILNEDAAAAKKDVFADI